MALLLIVLSTTSAFGAEVQVDIVTDLPCSYCPDPVVINEGDTVIWNNGDSTLHTAMSGTPAGGPTGLFGGTLDSPTLIAPSRTQEFTFIDKGEYTYYCLLHPMMVGTVVVSENNSVSAAIATLDGKEYTFVARSNSSAIVSAEIGAPSEPSGLGEISTGVPVNVSFSAPGYVELDVPASVLVRITGVMANGTVLEYEVINETELISTVGFTVPDDNLSVVIVPEFPPSIPIIASIGVFLLVILAKGRLNFHQFWKGRGN